MGGEGLSSGPSTRTVDAHRRLGGGQGYLSSAFFPSLPKFPTGWWYTRLSVDLRAHSSQKFWTGTTALAQPPVQNHTPSSISAVLHASAVLHQECRAALVQLCINVG